MGYSVKEFSNRHSFEIESVSYIGRPVNYSAMYVSKKVEHLVENLRHSKGCLVFAEDTVNVPEALEGENVFVMTPTPQKDYALFVEQLAAAKEVQERARSYTLTAGGYYLGENVSIGQNAWIEPGCLIGHDVIMGDNAVIRAGARILHSIIGDNFYAGENCTVGTYGFTMADDENGNKMRIPTLGDVRIGNHVEVNALSNISRGSAGSTVLEDYVKLDSLVHIGHDAHLHKNVEVTGGAIIGGFDELMENAYVGINATLRNRIKIGPRVTVGMSSVVTKSFADEGITIAGSPAKIFSK